MLWLDICLSVKSGCSIKNVEWIESVITYSLPSTCPRLCYHGIWVSPKIRVPPSGNLGCPNLTDFSAFSPRQIESCSHRRPSPTVASLSHWVSTLVYSRLAMIQSVTEFVSEYWWRTVIPRLHNTIGCHSGSKTGCIHDTASCQTGLTTGRMFVYTIQPVVTPIWQPVVSCIQTFNRLLNQFDNRLYCVNGA